MRVEGKVCMDLALVLKSLDKIILILSHSHMLASVRPFQVSGEE